MFIEQIKDTYIELQEAKLDESETSTKESVSDFEDSDLGFIVPKEVSLTE